MNKQALFGILLVVGLLFSADASSYLNSNTHMKRWESEAASLCPTCVQFSEQAINTLLNIILNTGVEGGCSGVCNLLADKTGSQPLGQICTILCDIVGVEAFSKLIQKADLDPIYFCELINTCAINDNGDAMITNLTVSPTKGPVGTTFAVNVIYHSDNGTGTGEMEVAVKTIDGIPMGSTFLLQSQKGGDYQADVKVNAKPDPSCDPSQQACENWLPGNYTVEIAVCNGECGSKHPHSQLYDQKMVTFEVTEN